MEWSRIESLFVAFLHPGKEAKPYQVRDARYFLEQAGVTP